MCLSYVTVCTLPGIAFAHFTAAITCRPPNMLSVVMIRQAESGEEQSYPAYSTSGSMTSSRDTRVGVSCGNVAGTIVLLAEFSEVSSETPVVACWIPFIFFFVFRAISITKTHTEISCDGRWQSLLKSYFNFSNYTKEWKWVLFFLAVMIVTWKKKEPREIHLYINFCYK